jgi:hypothetical protein
MLSGLTSFIVNPISSNIDGSANTNQSAFLYNLPTGTLIEYTNLNSPNVIGVFEVVSVQSINSNGAIQISANVISSSGAFVSGIAEFHFYSPGSTTNGEGEWYFYSDEGTLNAQPPEADGNSIFLARDTQNNITTETYNPNKSNGVDEIYFNLIDSVGNDYTTQFTALAENGGTITITQGANTVTYTSTVPGTFFVEPSLGFFLIQTGPATQTVTSANPFVFADPITISFN